ncbi:hypothetical protein [Rheinheimera nanhaiensis]|uniref:Uncharacterized protein n=1 Tax=Rheinheimera nanhaiensis E407-8 TaxID=562729 RepID=I1DUK0_9GAMM|nr:hypothetical protein [Rheinheimera nanhaiensis]GAB57728.1 hypothetical protein RNAN_0697 [Rheinheimera nanhaiensis E407-8]
MNKLLIAITLLPYGLNASDITEAFSYAQTTQAAYETATEYCLQQRKTEISLTSTELNLLTKIPYSEAIVPYLEQRAFLKCVSETKLNYIETLVLLERLNASVKSEEVSRFIRQQKEDNFHLIELEIKLDYMKLPLDVRERLESISSLHAPFDGVKLQELIWPALDN